MFFLDKWRVSKMYSKTIEIVSGFNEMENFKIKK